ncbi:MAG TPA: hypothetical protein VF484_08020, partial [Candidatus Limnocylindrales bacterium]
MLGVVVRAMLVGFGLFLMLLGLYVIAVFPDARFAGLESVAFGGFLIVVVAAERQRYRSEAAERSNAVPGPGGGERPGDVLEPRFRATSEAFIDPTTGHRMR